MKMVFPGVQLLLLLQFLKRFNINVTDSLSLRNSYLTDVTGPVSLVPRIHSSVTSGIFLRSLGSKSLSHTGWIVIFVR